MSNAGGNKGKFLRPGGTATASQPSADKSGATSRAGPVATIAGRNPVTNLSDRMKGMRFMLRGAAKEEMQVAEETKNEAKSAYEWSADTSSGTKQGAITQVSVSPTSQSPRGASQTAKRPRFTVSVDNDSVHTSVKAPSAVTSHGAILMNRCSFGGANKSIEVFAKREHGLETQPQDISDKEMLERYDAIHGKTSGDKKGNRQHDRAASGKKPGSKRQRPQDGGIRRGFKKIK